jgi:uncharacterized protein YbcC (UPF0753/DUF2309 family)
LVSTHTSEADASIPKILGHLAHYLPAQGPIGVFVHHNTLHAFQHKPFEEAVVEAARLYGNRAYMPEEAFRAEIARGRILKQDLEAAVDNEPNEEILPGRLDRRTLRRALLLNPCAEYHPETVEWALSEGSVPAELFQLCRELIGNAGDGARVEHARRLRDGILWESGVDLDEAIHPPLIRLCAAFLDQGVAYWPMPDRGAGLLAAARNVFAQPLSISARHLDRVPGILRKFAGSTAEQIVEVILNRLGFEDAADRESCLLAELLALPGWAGQMHRLEEEPHLFPHVTAPASLLEFMAVRMMLTLAAAESILGGANPVAKWRRERIVDPQTENLRSLAHAARLASAAERLHLDSHTLYALPESEFSRLRQEIEAFDENERCRLLQIAYELRHEKSILGPIGANWKYTRRPQRSRMAAQVFFCIDEREESIRRHLEEVDPDIETHGAAGFFGVAMEYTGIDDAHGAALCPVVVKPQHAVSERPAQGHANLHERRMQRRRAWASVARSSYLSSRSLFRGWISTTVLGLFSLFPLAGRVLAPRQFGKLVSWLNRGFFPEPRTELAFMRNDEVSHHATEGLMLGFSVQEKVDRVASVLAPAGLRNDLARLVVVLGHGSTSLNNPHESAHDCGACGGRRGGPNGRIFAAMANHPAVRAGLRSKGIRIPEDTWFVGGYHDTCSDELLLFDIDAVPATHTGDLNRVRESLDKARAWSAHERARRFEAASPGLDADGGLRHVQERAEHLAEPRPEYGHCTNSTCIVGRRQLTKGLFFDRRAFLVSYDATLDASNENLARLLGAVIPVCGGINLEYYFSFVDNERYGCGTKLPHNITGLVGVMNGYEGDLRTGLPWQMVEIHEPVRILFAIETTPERVLSVIDASPQLAEFLHNRWIRLATVDPDNGTMNVFRNGAFEPFDDSDAAPLPVARTSAEWYRGKMEHLPVARIGGTN